MQDLLVDAVTMLAVNAPPAFERVATLAIAGRQPAPAHEPTPLHEPAITRRETDLRSQRLNLPARSSFAQTPRECG